MEHKVELVFDSDCPNVEAAREQLRQALAATGHAAEWQEWNRESASAPAYVREYGSPTILVNGKDIAGRDSEADSKCCRVYADSDGQLRGVPTAELIRAALGG
ncbi:MAG: thioredoxin family protein [Gemmatimonadales bacterium]